MARPGAGQTHHVAFRAPDDDALEAWREHLRSLDVAVTEIREREYFRSIYFHAPDGMLFELATDGPGFTIDEDEGALGEALQLPSWLEARRDEIEANLEPLPAGGVGAPAHVGPGDAGREDA
jgi:glyoxalase family protein